MQVSGQGHSHPDHHQGPHKCRSLIRDTDIQVFIPINWISLNIVLLFIKKENNFVVVFQDTCIDYLCIHPNIFVYRMEFDKTRWS